MRRRPGPLGLRAVLGVPPMGGVRCGVRDHAPLKMLTKWVQHARLETRTKETCAIASVWVVKTRARNESKGRFGRLRWEGSQLVFALAAGTIDHSGRFY